MGKIAHADIGTSLTRAEFEANTTHTIGDVANLQIVRSATYVVAASDSTAASKAQADYVCDGTADDVQIQAAIDALPAGGGKIILLEGTYKIDAPVNINKRYVELSGMGTGGGWLGVTSLLGPIILEWTNVALGTILNIDHADGYIDGIKVSGFAFDCAGVARAMTGYSVIHGLFENLFISDVPTAASQAIYLGISANPGYADSHGVTFRNVRGNNPTDGRTPEFIEIEGRNVAVIRHVTKCSFHDIERVGDWNSTIKVNKRAQTCKFHQVSAVGSLVGDVVVVDAGGGNKSTVYDNVFEHIIASNPTLGISLANCIRQTFRDVGHEIDVAIGANVDNYYIEHVDGEIEASRWISQRTIWKDASEQALEQLNQNADTDWADLDLTAFTSGIAKFAIVQIVINTDAVTGVAGGWLYVGLRKNGTTPVYFPVYNISMEAVSAGQTYRSVSFIIGLDSGQEVEWRLQINPDDASWQVDFWIYVLGYLE